MSGKNIFFSAAAAGLVSLASGQNPHFPIYCKANGFCHVPGLPDSCNTDNDCKTPWYDSYCQSGAWASLSLSLSFTNAPTRPQRCR
jgi:hypothetical protein